MERQYWIRSKPVYSSLMWREQAQQHIVIAEGAGGQAVIKLLQQKYPSQATTGFYVQPSDGTKDYSPVMTRLFDGEFKSYAETSEALQAFAAMLDLCTMGSQFYIAGTEQFIWQAIDVLKPYGVHDDDVVKELTGTLARSVYCVHCKTITQDVDTNIAPCAGCQRMLVVRDHFSRRLGAYMGLMVDAEQPGNVPEIEEMYP